MLEMYWYVYYTKSTEDVQKLIAWKKNFPFDFLPPFYSFETA